MKDNLIDLDESKEYDKLMDGLDDLDKAIIHMKIENPTITNVKIAKQLEKNEVTIGKRLNEPKVRLAINGLQKQALQILLDAQVVAAYYLKTVIENEDAADADKIRACKQVLKGVLSEKVNVTIDSFSEWVKGQS